MTGEKKSFVFSFNPRALGEFETFLLQFPVSTSPGKNGGISPLDKTNGLSAV